MTKKRSGILSAVYIAIVVLFLYSPIALLIYRSFDFGSNDVFSAYKDFFKNTEAKNALKNTMVIAVLSSCISTVIGTAAAVGISKYISRAFVRYCFYGFWCYQLFGLCQPFNCAYYV